MSLIVPVEMGHKLSLPYLYLYTIIIAVQGTITRELLNKYISNPVVASSITATVGGYNALYSIYYKESMAQFIPK